MLNKTLSLGDVANWAISLLLVLAIFFACVWVMRKSARWTTQEQRQLSVIAGLSLGMREKIVLVEVGEKQILLAVTPGKIEKISELNGDDRLPVNSSQQPASAEFSRQLMQVIKGRFNE